MTVWPEGSLLAGLPAASREDLLNLGASSLYEPGRRLVLEGELSKHAILLRAGSVKITGQLDSGRDALLAIRARGDLVGELAALDNEPRSATVTTCSHTRVNVIAQGDFLRYLRTHPDANLAIDRMLAYRLRQANRRRLDFTGCEAPIRIARVLIELIEMYGRQTPSGIRCSVSLTQDELAALSGTAVDTVQKTLRVLQEQHAINWEYRRFAVTDVPALHRAAHLHPQTPV